MAPLFFIHSKAALVSNPPEKAMPTFWPTGTSSSMVVIVGRALEKHQINSTLYLSAPPRASQAPARKRDAGLQSRSPTQASSRNFSGDSESISLYPSAT